MALSLVFVLAFIITVALIHAFGPAAMMSEARTYRVAVPDIRHAVELCRTAAFGRPTLTLRPYRRRVTLKLEFLDDDRVLVIVPLILKKQRADMARIRTLLETCGTEVFDYAPDGETIYLRAWLDRSDGALGEVVVWLYRALFDAGQADRLEVKLRTLRTDGTNADLVFEHGGKVKEGATLTSRSQALLGRSVRWVLVSRSWLAANLLLYPPMLLGLYALFGLPGVAWGVLGFALSGTTLRYLKHGPLALDADTLAVGSIAGVAAASLATGEFSYLKGLPLLIGLWGSIKAGGKLLEAMDGPAGCEGGQCGTPRANMMVAIAFLVINLGVVALGEWARVSLGTDDWVRFFVFLRYEMMAAMLVLMLPVIAMVVVLDERGEA